MDMESFIDMLLAQEQVLSMPLSIDYFAVIVGALTGALFACKRKLDPIGAIVLGLVTAYGGGLIRDAILQNQGVYFTEHPDLILICVLLCLFVFYFRGLFKHLDAVLSFCDTMSIALFALAGANKAMACGQGVVVSITLGIITAVGGGMLRDVFAGEVPAIFKKSNYYAVAALGGAIVYVSLAEFGCPVVVAGILSVLCVLALRYASMWFGFETRQEADFTPAVMQHASNLKRTVSSRPSNPKDGGDEEKPEKQGQRLGKDS